jgi:hypothetical protein
MHDFQTETASGKISSSSVYIMQEGHCILLSEHYISTELTSIDMAEPPLCSMQILGNKLLGRPDLLVVLRWNKMGKWLDLRYKPWDQGIISRAKWLKIKCANIITSGGKQSSAARRGTENPPCVLVSEAVSVLQNMCSIPDFLSPSPSSVSSSPSVLPPPMFLSKTWNQRKCAVMMHPIRL